MIPKNNRFKFLPKINSFKVYSYNWLGILFVFIAAASFAVKGIIAKFAFQEGVSITNLLFLRFAISTPLFWLGFYLFKRESNTFSVTVQDFKKCFLTGFLFLISALSDFAAISIMDVGVERIIFFTYPCLIILLMAILTRKLPPRSNILAFIITYIGVVMIAGITTKWSIFTQNLLGIFLALIAALFYALFLIKSKNSMIELGAIKFTVVSNTITFNLLLFYYIFSGQILTISVNQNCLFYILIIAVFCTVIPFFLLFEGIKRIGVSKTGIISMIGPSITVLAAYFLLGERLSFHQIIGIIITVFGIFLLNLSGWVREAKIATNKQC